MIDLYLKDLIWLIGLWIIVLIIVAIFYFIIVAIFYFNICFGKRKKLRRRKGEEK